MNSPPASTTHPPRGGMLVVALSLALAAPQLQAETKSVDEPEQATKLETVLVVGSHIRRTDIETSQPVFVIERAQIERSGLVSVGDLLQDLTAHGAASNTLFNLDGTGETRVDLRDLGSSRTLVLLNGRRLSTTLDGAVDLSAIPLAIVDRVEVLKDGASAIYGSDAIAGVINIHTRRDYSGSEARVYFGQHAAGDGRIETYNFTHGWERDRAALALDVSRTLQDPIFARDRAISAVPRFGLPAHSTEVAASQFTPLGRFGFGRSGSCAFDPSAQYPASGCSDPGRFPPMPATTYDPITGGFRVFNRDTDGYNFNQSTYLQTPYERSALYLQGHYELNPATAFEFEALYNQRRSRQQLAPAPFQLAVNRLPPSRHVIAADHVYNPFGQDINRLGLRLGDQFRIFRQDADTFRIGGGFNGAAEWFGHDFDWDLNALHADQRVGQVITGHVDGERLLLALGPSFRDGTGMARCGTPAAPIAGCVPLDAFRGPDALTPEMLDYLFFTARDSLRSKLANYSANLAGEVFDLPAGPMAVALGYEYRRETALYEPDPQLRAANVSSTVSGGIDRIGGSSVANEAYLELALPLLTERRWAHNLELSLASRRSHYAGFGSTTNSKAGLRWSPVASLLLRGNWSQGFRAPNLAELFGPQSRTGGFVGPRTDPCAVAAPSPEVRANCIADGVPGGSYDPAGSPFESVFGGNPDLQPEEAIDRTLGLVWSPLGIAGLDFSLDWYRIEIESAISEAGDILRACAEQGVAEACARTGRDPATGELLLIDYRLLNSGTLRVAGYDFTVHYRWDSRVGRFDLLWDSAYRADYITEVPRGVEPTSVIGNYYGREDSGWRIRSNIDLAWQRGDIGAALGLRYYDDLDEGCYLDEQPAFAPVCSNPDVQSATYGGLGENRIPSRWYLDLQTSWETPWNATFRVGLHNALDQDPPVSLNVGNSFDPAHPVPGRFGYLSYTQSF